jgi:hypothetical protein
LGKGPMCRHGAAGTAASPEREDLLVCGAEFLGVEEHEVPTRGAFDSHSKSQIAADVLSRGPVSTRGEAAVNHEHRGMAHAERIRQSAYGAVPQAKLPKRVRDLGHETPAPSHASSYLLNVAGRRTGSAKGHLCAPVPVQRADPAWHSESEGAKGSEAERASGLADPRGVRLDRCDQRKLASVASSQGLGRAADGT